MDMIKKFFAKLMNFTEQKENFAKSAFRADQKEQERMARPEAMAAGQEALLMEHRI